jgi:hypothetical protein
MQLYRDVDGDSAVVAFEEGPDFLRVQFDDGGVYLYTMASAGAMHLDRVKQLARSGEGLNAYINRHLRKRYARKER